MNEVGLQAGLLFGAAALLLPRDWRWSIAGVAVIFLVLAGFLSQQQFTSGPGSGAVLPLVELVTGVVVVSILVITGLRCRVTAAAGNEWSDYFLPAVALCITGAIALLTPRVYPLPPGNLLSLRNGWLWLLPAGLLQLGLTTDLLKLSCGACVLVIGLQLMYFELSTGASLLMITLLPVALIALALLVASLCVLHFEHTGSLQLGAPPGSDRGE